MKQHTQDMLSSACSMVCAQGTLVTFPVLCYPHKINIIREEIQEYIAICMYI